MKAIVITGGVVSGLGKGVLTASIAALLGGKHKIVCIKLDGYLNADPGTMNPIEHGEVFVLSDGGEVDMDFGHYERFANLKAKHTWNITMGKVYSKILEDERAGKYLGQTVQLIPHATNEIKRQIYETYRSEKADLALIEVGGTVGDMENELFIEATRQLRRDLGIGNVIYFHLTYMPRLVGSKEFKSKPTQASVRVLNQAGIYPDAIFLRVSEKINQELKEKIALHCNVDPEHIFSNVDQKSIYALPLSLQDQSILDLVENKLGVEGAGLNENFHQFVKVLKENNKKSAKKIIKIKIGICGKYTKLHDSYVSIREALLHAKIHLEISKDIHIDYDLEFVNTDAITRENSDQALARFEGVIIPGGFGIRGIEGKIELARLARINDIPLLGICLGMQVMIIEFARNICKMQSATTREVLEKDIDLENSKDESLSKDIDKANFVIDLLPSQRDIVNKGGTMRLGEQRIYLKDKSIVRKIFAKDSILQRFRHRYEVNPKYVKKLGESGMVFSGSTKKDEIQQICELPGKGFYLGTQSHPELTSTPTHPSIFFTHFLASCIKDKP